jgi:hypothetical protein
MSSPHLQKFEGRRKLRRFSGEVKQKRKMIRVNFG